jgi:hypothetical protein
MIRGANLGSRFQLQIDKLCNDSTKRCQDHHPVQPGGRKMNTFRLSFVSLAPATLCAAE